jgi:tRNA (pseudouridine54-N1)-methyltransferase
MREFVLRARKAPTTPDFSLVKAPPERHLEIVAHCMVNALFCADRIRPGVTLQLVFDGPAAPPKTVRLDSDALGSLPGLDEGSLWRLLQQALGAGRHLELAEEIQPLPGVFVAKAGFEALVRRRSGCQGLFYLCPDGDDIRSTDCGPAPCFLFTDHLAMPRHTDRFLDRLGARRLSVGPRMLYASQCIAVVQNELDRRGLD